MRRFSTDSKRVLDGDHQRTWPSWTIVVFISCGECDGFSLELSPQTAENVTGITRTTFYKHLRLLEIHGDLVWHRANDYDFYTVPQPEDKRPHPNEHDTKLDFCVSSSLGERPPSEQKFKCYSGAVQKTFLRKMCTKNPLSITNRKRILCCYCTEVWCQKNVCATGPFFSG